MHEVAVPPGAVSPHALGGIWTFTPMEPVPGPGWWQGLCGNEALPLPFPVAPSSLFPVLLLSVLPGVACCQPVCTLAIGVSITLKVGTGRLVLLKQASEHHQDKLHVPPRCT